MRPLRLPNAAPPLVLPPARPAGTRALQGRRLGVAPRLTANLTTFAATTYGDAPLENPSWGTTCVESGDSKCSLRGGRASRQQPGHAVVIDLPADEVSGDAVSDYQLSPTYGTLLVENPGGTSIVGAGASTTIISASSLGVGVMQLTDGASGGSSLDLTGVTLSGGAATASGGGLDIADGNDTAVLKGATRSPATRRQTEAASPAGRTAAASG